MQAQLWTISGLAVETGFSRRHVARTLTHCAVADKNGRSNCYWMRDAGPLIYGNESRGIDLREQRARQHKEMADKLEMENVKRRAELVDAGEVAALWQRLTTEVSQRLMQIPMRVGEQLTRARTCDAQRILDAEIRSALADLSADRADV